MAERLIRVVSQPGVKRDGTVFEGDAYTDALWMRIQRGLPRKMNGYRAVNRFLSGIARTLHGYTRDMQTYVHAGSSAALESFVVDSSGNTSLISDRTPSTLTADDNTMWQFDVLSDGTAGTSILIAQSAPNLNCICNSLGGQLFTGDLLATTALTEVTGGAGVPANFDATGGVVSLHPYSVVFGSNGYVAWSVPGTPADYVGAGAGNAYVTEQKLIKGLPLRGGPGNTPSGLLWSANSLIRMSYVGGSSTFDFDTLSAKISVMGSATIIEYDGIFYWIGTDRFMQFNGVVGEVENTYNRDWFFNNVNMQYRQKVYAMANPRYGEIWWCYPHGTATECTHAIIYNVREKLWYDTPLPNGGRAAAISPEVFPLPMMSGVEAEPYIITAAVVVNGGSGYAVGDILSVSGGSGSCPVELTVAAEAAGVILTVTITNAGCYDVVPDNPVDTTTTGSGIGATFTLTPLAPYRFWLHETGLNEIVGTDEQPVRSYFTTGEFSFPMTEGINRWMRVVRVEPDFVQTGDMHMTLIGRVNARATDRESVLMPIPETATSALEQTVTFSDQFRLLRFHFESNALGGYYEMGHTLAHVAEGDATVTS